MKKFALLVLGFVAAALVLSGCNDNTERSAHNFVDNTKKSWSRMTKAAQERFVIGYDRAEKPGGQDFFQPDRTMTRREGATMVMRVYDQVNRRMDWIQTVAYAALALAILALLMRIPHLYRFIHHELRLWRRNRAKVAAPTAKPAAVPTPATTPTPAPVAPAAPARRPSMLIRFVRIWLRRNRTHKVVHQTVFVPYEVTTTAPGATTPKEEKTMETVDKTEVVLTDDEKLQLVVRGALIGAGIINQITVNNTGNSGGGHGNASGDGLPGGGIHINVNPHIEVNPSIRGHHAMRITTSRHQTHEGQAGSAPNASDNSRNGAKRPVAEPVSA